MISIIVVMLAVSIVMKNIFQEKYKYTDDINQFKIFSGKGMPLVFDISAIFWFALTFFSYGAENSEDKYMWLGFLVIGIISAICSLAMRKKITVSGNDIIYQALIPYKKNHYTFNEIDHVETLDGGKTVVIGGNGKLFSFDMDFLGSDNFIKRCEKEGKKITSKGGKPLTKKDFLKSKITLVLMAIFSVATAVFIGPTAIAKGEVIDLIIFILVIGVGIPVVLYLFMVPKTYFFISRMEKALGFDFDKVMVAAEIGKIPYIDANWFINGDNMEKVVINRKFVSKIESTIEGEAGNVNVVIRTSDNKRKKYIMRGPAANQFVDWVNGILPKNEEEKDSLSNESITKDGVTVVPAMDTNTETNDNNQS